jgi:VWFA-related protein
MQDALESLEKVHNRRKALVWVSEGYDFNPFQGSRLGPQDGNSSPFLQNETNARLNTTPGNGTDPNQQTDPFVKQQQQAETFSDAELAHELGEITRAANRANTTIYTIDPRGLVAGSDIDEPVDPMEWSSYLRKSQDSLRVLSEETGGVAVVNMNDFEKALKNIDAASSDYYVLGYYSNNPDQTRRRRQLDVKITRKNLNVFSRKEYVLRAPKPAAASAAPKP